MNTKAFLGASLAALALVITPLSSQSAEALKVDFGSEDQAVQEGFEAWSIGPYNRSDGNVGLTMSFNVFGGVTVSMVNADGSDNGLSIRERVNNATGALGPLIQDAIKQSPSGGLLRLVFSQLKAGQYQLTTYHHDATAVHGTMDLFLTDANGADQLVADEVRLSTGSADPQVATAVFRFRSDGVNDVFVRMVIGSDANNAEVWLNGFMLEQATGDAITITKQPDSAAVTTGSAVTFTVEAIAASGASNFTYQWQKDGANITGATSATYTIAAVQAEAAGKYRCLVSLPGGISATSDEATLRIQTQANLPTVSSGTLKVHLKADAGVTSDATGVTLWKDQSANGYEFGPFVPEILPTLETGLTGNKVVRFNGNTLLKSSVPMQLFTTPDSGLSLFVAFSTVNNSGQKFVLNWGIQSEEGKRGNLELGYDTGNGDDGNFGLHVGCSLASVAPGGTIANHEFAIMSTLVKSTGIAPNNVAIYKNGIARPVNLNGTTGCNQNHAGWLDAGEYNTGEAALDIGARDDTGAGNLGSFHNGDIAEVLVYLGTLSDTDRAAVEKYLGDKYGINTTPPPIVAVVERCVKISYPAAAFDYVLEATPSLSPATWTAVAVTPGKVGDNLEVIIPHDGSMYYRLRKP